MNRKKNASIEATNFHGRRQSLFSSCDPEVRWFLRLLDNAHGKSPSFEGVLVESGIPTIPSCTTAEQLKTAEENKLMDLKAKNYLFQAIDKTILETILNKDTAKYI